MIAPNLTGKRYGRLEVIAKADPIRRPSGIKGASVCLCACGTKKVVENAALINGRTKSCGCLKPEIASAVNTHHGHGAQGKQSKTYVSWYAMKTRCTNPNAQYYRIYGGRGVRVCEQWLHSFQAFLRDMGERPEGRTLDRIDPNGNYEPGNCRWATSKEQVKNRRKAND